MIARLFSKPTRYGCNVMLATAVAWLFCGLSGQAATFHWIANPVDEYWGTTGNWDTGTAPNASDADVFFTASAITTVDIDLHASQYSDRSVRSIVFNGSDSFTLRYGGVIYLKNSSGILVQPGSPGQTFNVEVRPTIGGSHDFNIVNNGSGTLAFDRNINASPGCNATVIFDGTGGITISKLIRRHATQTTNVSLVKNGSGTLTITDADTRTGNARGDGTSYGAPTGTTTINAGTIRIDDEANLGANPGGYWTWDGSVDTFVPGTFNPAALTLNGGILQATASFAIDDSNRGITVGSNGGTFAVDATRTLTIGNVITGGGSLTKAGDGTLSLNAENTYTGNTRVTAGTLTLGHASAIAGSTLDLAAADAGTVAFGAPTTYTLGGLEGTRDLNMGGNTLAMGANGQSTEYGGSLSNGSLVKTGAGTLTLSGTNTHNATIISEGNLKFLTDANLGAAGAGITLDGGTLQYDVAAWNYSVSRPITLTDDSYLLGGGNSLRLSGKISDGTDSFGLTLMDGYVSLTNSANDYDGATIVADGGFYVGANGALGTTNGATFVEGSGILTVDTNYATPETLHLNGGVLRTSYGGGGTATWAGDIILGANSTIRAKVHNGQGTLVVAGTISGDYGINVGQGTSEAGIVKLTGTNTYTGATNLNYGTLVVNDSIAASSGLTTASGTLVQGSGTVSALSGAGLVSPGNSPGILTAASVDPAGGLDFAFEFTAAAPDYTSATGSRNDVLRLTDTSDPLTAALSTDNEIGIYLNVADLEPGDVFLGGLYTDLGEDFADLLAGATVNAYVALDGNGANVFEGVGYYDLAELAFPLNAVLSTVAATADFGNGTVQGYVMQVTVLPEPSAYLLAVVMLTSFLPMRRRRVVR